METKFIIKEIVMIPTPDLDRERAAQLHDSIDAAKDAREQVSDELRRAYWTRFINQMQDELEALYEKINAEDIESWLS